jgi:hypothetical protein
MMLRAVVIQREVSLRPPAQPQAFQIKFSSMHPGQIEKTVKRHLLNINSEDHKVGGFVKKYFPNYGLIVYLLEEYSFTVDNNQTRKVY